VEVYIGHVADMYIAVDCEIFHASGVRAGVESQTLPSLIGLSVEEEGNQNIKFWRISYQLADTDAIAIGNSGLLDDC